MVQRNHPQPPKYLITYAINPFECYALTFFTFSLTIQITSRLQHLQHYLCVVLLMHSCAIVQIPLRLDLGFNC